MDTGHEASVRDLKAEVAATAVTVPTTPGTVSREEQTLLAARLKQGKRECMHLLKGQWTYDQNDSEGWCRSVETCHQSEVIEHIHDSPKVGSRRSVAAKASAVSTGARLPAGTVNGPLEEPSPAFVESNSVSSMSCCLGMADGM